MGDYYIELPFKAASYIDFAPGCYIIYNGRKFEVMDKQYPEFDSSTGGYKYTVKFQAQQNHLKRRKVFWLKGSKPEATFHNTTTLDQFGQLIADNMNAFIGGNNWVFGAAPADLATTAKVVSFNGDSCWNALSTIAETFEVEWWTEENGDQIWLYFGKLEFGTPEEFRRGDVVTEIPHRRGDDAEYGTRFYVFGSTRNLPESYKDSEQGGITNHVSEVRLHLPEGIDYIDAKENLSPAEIIEQVAFFEDIYPKNTDTVTDVTTVERSIEGAEDEEPQTFTAYQVVAADTPFVPSDMIEGETLMIRFTSGSLNGMEFEADLRDDDDNKIDPSKWDPSDGYNKKIEIIAQTEDAGDSIIIVPNEYLKPAIGDTYILTGIELPEARIREAEEELLEAGKVWAKKKSSDTSVYDCPTNPVYCSDHDKNYDAGQKVLLVDPRFEGGSRESRIQGFEKHLWNEYIATYTVGDNTSYTRIGELEESIESSAYAERIGIVKGVGIYLIRSKYDLTAPTDYNVYSALATEALFLNKRKGGTVYGTTTFDRPVIGAIQSENYNDGAMAGVGYKLGQTENGDSLLEVDKIIVRKEAQFNTLLVNQIGFTLGETIFSNGGCELTRVEPMDGYYRCYYDNHNGQRYSGILLGDLVRCQRYSPSFDTISKYYWRVVVSVGDDYFDLSDEEKDGSGIPEVGDACVQFGNKYDRTRQSAIVIDPRNGGSVEVYAEINSFDLTDKHFVGIGTNASSGEAYLYGFGNANIGNRDGSSYVKVEKRDGDTGKRVYVKGGITIEGGSSGLENLTEWPEKQQEINDAVDAVADLDYLKKALPGDDTIVDNGVILSSVIGVKDGSSVVAAMTNTANGWPYFAAGIGDIQDVHNTSKLLIDLDGNIELRDTSADASVQRRVKMSEGAIEYFGGESLELTQTSDTYNATPSSDMLFDNLAQIETKDLSVDLYGRHLNYLVPDPIAAGITGISNVLICSLKAGVDYTKISIGSSSTVIGRFYISEAYNGSVKVTPVILNEKNATIAIGSQVTLSTLPTSIYGVEYLDSQFSNQTVRFALRLEVYRNEIDTADAIDISKPPTINGSFSNVLFTIHDNVNRTAYDNRLFGNGYFFAKSATQYAGAIVDSDNGACAEMRNGNTGFRFTADGPQRWHAKLGWIPMDGVLFRGTCGTTTSWATPDFTLNWSYLGTAKMTASQNSNPNNQVLMTFPSSFSTISGSWTASDYMVMVCGRKDNSASNGIFAAVTTQNARTFTVFTGDDNSPNNGYFNFEVKAL